MGWEPIETVPKGSDDPYICYSPGNKRALTEYARDPHVHIDGFSERWPKGRNQYPESPYTHWMPLPEPPKQ